MKKLYIFDFDGMLVDTIEDSMNNLNTALKEFNLPTFNQDLSNFIYEDLRQFLRDNNASKDSPVYPRYIELCKITPLKHTCPYEGIMDVLKELERRGIVLAICSNREQKVLEKLTERFLKDINFKYISGFRFGVPDKPNPYRLNEIIEKEGINKEEVLYFGDKDVDITVSKNAGVDVVIVSYGQGDEEVYNDSYPLKIIGAPNEILDL